MSIEDREWLEVINMYVQIVCKASPESAPTVRRLIELKHISKQTIIHFMALQMYPDALAQNSGHMAAITDIAVRLNVSERTIWSVLQRQKK